MSSSKCSFTCISGIFLSFVPSTTTVYSRSAFYPNQHFTLSLQSASYTQSALYPWSAVPSPQSAVCVFQNRSIDKVKNLGNERRYIYKDLAKTQVRRIFRIRDIRRNVLPKLIENCMETPCWCSPSLSRTTLLSHNGVAVRAALATG